MNLAKETKTRRKYATQILDNAPSFASKRKLSALLSREMERLYGFKYPPNTKVLDLKWYFKTLAESTSIGRQEFAMMLHNKAVDMLDEAHEKGKYGEGFKFLQWLTDFHGITGNDAVGHVKDKKFTLLAKVLIEDVREENDG